MITTLIAPYLSLTICALSAGYFVTFVSIFLEGKHASALILSITHSAYYFGLLIGALFTEKQIIKIGHIRAYAVYVALIAISVLMLTYARSFDISWILCRFITGYCLAGIYVVIEGWFLALSEPKNRGVILTLYTMALYGANAFGQFLIDYIDHFSLEPYVFTAMVFAISMLPVLLTTKKIPEVKTVPKLAIKQISALAPYSTLGCLVSGLSLSVIYSFGPSYATSKNINVSSMMFAIIIGGTVLPVVFGKISDVIDRRLVMIGFSIVLIPVLLVSNLWMENKHVLWAINFFIGGCTFAIYPICISRLIDYTHEDYILSATAVALLFYGIGSSIGPIIASYIFKFTSIENFYNIQVGLMLILITLMILSLIQHKGKPKLHSSNFIPNSSTSPIINEIDPRT